MNIETHYLPQRGASTYYRVLVGNDRVRDDEPDCWKYKIVAPYSTWSIGADTHDEALAEARRDIEVNG